MNYLISVNIWLYLSNSILNYLDSDRFCMAMFTNEITGGRDGGASLLACLCTCAFTSMRTGDDAFEEEKLEHLKFLLEYYLQVPLPPSKNDSLNSYNFDGGKKK